MTYDNATGIMLAIILLLMAALVTYNCFQGDDDEQDD